METEEINVSDICVGFAEHLLANVLNDNTKEEFTDWLENADFDDIRLEYVTYISQSRNDSEDGKMMSQEEWKATEAVKLTYFSEVYDCLSEELDEYVDFNDSSEDEENETEE